MLTFIKFRNVQLHYVQIIYTKFPQHQTINMKIWITVHLCPYIQYGFQCNDFYTTHTHYIFVGISCTKCWLRQKCKKCGQNFTHNKYIMAFIAPIFLKFTTTQCTNLLYRSVSKRVIYIYIYIYIYKERERERQRERETERKKHG